jgi:hypothetical protein
LKLRSLFTAAGVSLLCAAAAYGHDLGPEPYEVACSLTVTPEYNNLVKQVTIWGEVNLPFTNQFDYPVSSVVVSVIDANGSVVTSREMFGTDQSMAFMIGTEKVPKPIAAGATTKMIHQGFNQVLWSMNVFGIEDVSILEKAASMMENEAAKLRSAYGSVRCRIDGVNK